LLFWNLNDMTRSSDNRWLHRFAVFAAVATFCLIWVGGLVTSHGAGMAVPDWPTTYGYNLFFFPFSKWVGGIFYEHTHRLVASGVGFLTIILAVWLWLKEERRWLRWLGGVALGAVILQGVLGGLRVTQMKDALGVFHATLAQLFFALMSAIALFTSASWRGVSVQKMSIYATGALRYSFATVTGLILFQLILGATMRHQHAGLAIPDFPAAYGKLWPAMDPDSIARYNQARGEVVATNPITAFQIGLQMAHRATALTILVSVAWLAGAARQRLGGKSVLSKLSLGWLGLVLFQAVLGAATIWTNKAADLATAHVAVGALSLLTGVMSVLVASRLAPGPAENTISAARGADTDSPPRPAAAIS
jgi:cytochrome c oxidase assembly protein subunit 15